MCRLGVISAYPDEDWHAQRIVAAARAVADVDVLSPLDFSADIRVTNPRDPRDRDGQRLLVRGRPHDEYDAFLTPRALGEEGDHELQLEIYRTLADEGALLLNDVRALTVAIDKFKTSFILARAGIPTPRVIVTQRLEEARPALDALGGRAVSKPLYGSLGIGVELLDARSPSSEAQLAQCMAQRKALYLQAFVEAGGRDVRAFVVGERVVAAIARIAAPGEFRTNVHQGGRPEPARLSTAAESVAVRATRLLGLDYAGVDLLESPAGPVVLEVNGTPLFRGIYEATGEDMAIAIVEHALLRLASREGRSRGASVDSKGENRPWRRRAASRRAT